MTRDAGSMTRRSVAVALLGAAITGLSALAPALAQDRFPTQTIKIIVPYPPGGSTDLIGRQLAELLSREVGQTVVVDNRPGAGTNIGANSVVMAKPDGYTLLFGGVAQVLNPVFGPVPPFDVTTALEPVGLVARVPFIVAANTKMPFSTPAEMIAAARSAPGRVTVSSAQLDVYVALLNAKADIKLLHVPYKGGAPATTDAISGQVNMVYALVPVLLPQILGGKLKAVAVTSAKRIQALPNTPAFAELGIDSDVAAWYGLMAPAGTPKPVIDRLSAALQEVMNMPCAGATSRKLNSCPLKNRPRSTSGAARRRWPWAANRSWRNAGPMVP
jgi:tripartite-type tricarboxylate transporter receptor subunit TctC